MCFLMHHIFCAYQLQEKNEKLMDSASKKKEAYIAGKTHGGKDIKMMCMG